jgi:hypothetical protein
VIVGFTSLISFFSGITILHCLLSNIWKQLFHVVPFTSCLQTE